MHALRRWSAALIALAIAAAPDPGAPLRAAASAYYADAGAIAAITGRDTAMDYYQRLLADAALLQRADPYFTTLAQLDLDAATQLQQRSFRSMDGIRGLGETFVRSSKDATMQAVAVYVPATYAPGAPAPLAVFLHGRDQTETELLSSTALRDLADATGTILVAPYGRGYFDFRGSEADVYDALDAAERAFTTAPRKRYLAGYSMGGFSVYRIGPMQPRRWSAIMSISGSLLRPQADRVVALLRAVPFYVVTGSDDDNIPSPISAAAAVYLRDAGLPVSFYRQPGGGHRLSTLLPVLSQAWADMNGGVVRTSAYSSTVSLPWQDEHR